MRKKVSLIIAGLIVLAISSGAGATGYLWLSGYDWSGNPTPIYRYNIAADTIDLIIDTGMPDQMVNNLAVNSDTLYIGAGHGPEFWRARAIDGVVYGQGSYTPDISGFRAESDLLYLAAYWDNTTKLYVVDPTAGTSTLVCDLAIDSGYPTGAWPQAMGWVRDPSTSAEQSSWGQMKSIYRGGDK